MGFIGFIGSPKFTGFILVIVLNGLFHSCLARSMQGRQDPKAHDMHISTES